MKYLIAMALLGTALTHAGPAAPTPAGDRSQAPLATPDTLARWPDGSVGVPMAAQIRLGLRTALTQQGQASAAVELPGRVVMDPNAGGRVQPLVSGRLQPGPKGLPAAGQTVRQGEVLAYVAFQANPIDAANQQALLAQVRASRQLLEQRVARLELLEGTVPRKDMEAARAELQSLTERERVLGASLGAREALVAPVSGVIASASAVAGQMVDPRDVLYEIVDPQRAWIEATSADATLAARIGGASLAGLPGLTLQWLGGARALREGALPLNFRVQSPGPMPLAIGQSVTVIVQLKQQVQGTVLPAQAITRNAANEPVVWVKVGAERFVAQPVKLQPLDAQTVLVTQGLSAQTRVVVQGAWLVAQVR